jgi:flagellar biosynthesis/type III secretory pathway chaperone
MSTVWTTIADSLRSEVSEYGQLLSLMEEQQRCIFRRDAEGVMQTNRSIRAQVDVLQDCRLRREKATAEFASAHGQPPRATVRSLVPHVVPEGRPLIEALVGEVNRLIHRVRRTMRLNQRLLAGTVECYQEILRRLWPAAFTTTYASDGRVSLGLPRRSSSVQIAG